MKPHGSKFGLCCPYGRDGSSGHFIIIYVGCSTILDEVIEYTSCLKTMNHKLHIPQIEK